ncbi:collagen alpha-1(I) chain-like [Manis pentadactyla]|uniref:collagen alpha-1(I) chain-like n=1 Tax=Manis pentadactyla TaxID=143292 RepID=UPI00255C59A6|nr:collagen alpha-1(I) chain-like [Manis pentadactyla]
MENLAHGEAHTGRPPRQRGPSERGPALPLETRPLRPGSPAPLAQGSEAGGPEAPGVCAGSERKGGPGRMHAGVRTGPHGYGQGLGQPVLTVDVLPIADVLQVAARVLAAQVRVGFGLDDTQHEVVFPIFGGPPAPAALALLRVPGRGARAAGAWRGGPPAGRRERGRKPRPTPGQQRRRRRRGLAMGGGGPGFPSASPRARPGPGGPVRDGGAPASARLSHRAWLTPPRPWRAAPRFPAGARVLGGGGRLGKRFRFKQRDASPRGVAGGAAPESRAAGRTGEKRRGREEAPPPRPSALEADAQRAAEGGPGEAARLWGVGASAAGLRAARRDPSCPGLRVLGLRAPPGLRAACGVWRGPRGQGGWDGTRGAEAAPVTTGGKGGTCLSLFLFLFLFLCFVFTLLKGGGTLIRELSLGSPEDSMVTLSSAPEEISRIPGLF